MSRSRDLILLGVWAMPGFAIQVAGLHWGLAGGLAGGLLCGVVVWSGPKVLGLSFEQYWPLPLAAFLASLLGVSCGRLAGAAGLDGRSWAAPVLAAAPSGLIALSWLMRGKRCVLCRQSLRSVLSFSCPRCSMQICEYCWEFGRERCRLCEANHIALLPTESAWWMDRFGERRLNGDCTLCRTSAAGSHTPQWACAGCGHNQCAECWDDCNGICSHCRWAIPDIFEKTGDEAATRHVSPKDNSYA
jgi:hypothetical protein